jgi:hypothetical protein
MMGEQARTESLFYYFRLEEQIPEEHLLRMLDRYIDFSFVRERLRGSTAQPAVRRLIPRCCYACCWSAICTVLPASGVCWMKCGCI